MKEIQKLGSIEVLPRTKVLFISLYPDPESKAHINIATSMFEFDGKDVDDFRESMLAKIESPEKDPEKGYALKQSMESTIPLPESLDDIQAIVISGSPYNIGMLKRDLGKLGYEDRGKGAEWFVPHWHRKLVKFIQQADAKGKPMLGICAGAQLISESLGGKLERLTEKGSKVTERGWGIVKRIGDMDDPLLEGLPSSFVVPLNHLYTISRLPPGGNALAESRFGLQVYRKGDAWGVMFHPEKDPEKVEAYYDNPKTVIKYEKWDWDLDGERELSKQYKPEMVKKIFINFMRIAWRDVQ